MANSIILFSKTLTSIVCFLLLATTLASSARILDDLTLQLPVPISPDTSDPIVPPETNLPEVAQPVAATPTTNVPDIPIIETPPLTATVPPVTTPVAATPTTDIPIIETPPLTAIVPPVTTPVAATPTTNVPDIPIIETPPLITSVPPVTTPVAATPSAGATTPTSTNPISDHPTLSFFMHDILGGSHPSGRVVTGIVANSDRNNLPFSKPNNEIFPINGGVPLNTINGAINNNNYPFLIGLNGSPTSTLIQNNGNNVVTGNNNQPFVTGGQLPSGLTLQQLMFGSVTVVDNEITEGHELGSSILGKVEGFYLTSSSDGSSHTVVLTATFHSSNHEIVDTVSFFGVHRTATPISHIAIIGGTGKYENAKGYATIETLPHEDQHTTDGLETITHFTLYLTP